MKTILFSRVSSREQEETGYSLPSQEKLLKEYAERKEFKIAKKFSISESASGRYQRKTFNEMLDYIERNNIKIIICEKVDRLTRNLKDAVCINDWINKDPERQVHFIKENCILTRESKSNDKFIWNIKVSVAQYYIDNLSEEVKKGQKEKISQGWLPTVPPLGYKTIGDKGKKIHIIDNDKAPLIKKMFELYATSNYSLKKLVETMHNEGLRTRYGNQLVKSRLASLLSDPFYYGKNRWKNEITNGKQEPLIGKELFDKVQDVLHGKSTPKYRKHLFEFKGLLKCTECGGTITWEKHKGMVYGHCNHYRNCSQETWVKEPEIEQQLIKVFDELQIKDATFTDWIKGALKESHKDEMGYYQSSLNELNKRNEQIQKRLDRLYDDKLDSIITKETYDKKFKQYSEEKENIIQSIQNHSRASINYFELGMNIYELSQRAREIYSTTKDNERKRQLINLVFDNLNLNEGKLSFVYSKPFEVIARAIGITNSSKVLNLTHMSIKNFELSNLALKNTKFGAKCPELNPMLRR